MRGARCGAVVTCAVAISAMGWAGQTSAFADPPGNNGTVKIASEGDIDLIPDNEPHPGCTFTVQWYGFDAGADVVSHVSFSMQAPTIGDGYGLEVNGPASVFVGADDASGAGNDPDGEQVYVLSFTGEPHSQQGYHVELVVNTPYSKGEDRKSKVFWVEGCAPVPSPTETPTETVTQTPTETATVTPTETTTLPTESGTSPTVFGTETVATPTSVPTDVDAGAGGGSTGQGWLWFVLGWALVLAGGSLLRRPTGRHSV